MGKTMNSDDPEQFNSCVMELEDMLLGYIEKCGGRGKWKRSLSKLTQTKILMVLL